MSFSGNRTQDKRSTARVAAKGTPGAPSGTAGKTKARAGEKILTDTLAQGRMHVAKAGLAGSVVTSVTVRRGARPSARAAGAVEARTTSYTAAFADLGEGYALVKLLPPATSATETVTPAEPKPISVRTIRRLLRNLADRATPSGEAGATDQADNDAFMANLQQEAMRSRARLRDEGKLLESADICDRLHVTRQALSKAVAEQRLFSLDGPAGRKLYPAFYSDAKLPKRDFERVAQTLGQLPGATKWQFFTTPASSLGGKTPVEALSKGKFDDVLRAAGGFLERELGD